MIMYGRYYSIPCADSKGVLYPVSLQFTFTFFLNIPSFFHFFEYRLLTPGRSGNSFNSKEVEHLRNLNYVNTLYSIIR